MKKKKRKEKKKEKDKDQNEDIPPSSTRARVHFFKEANAKCCGAHRSVVIRQVQVHSRKSRHFSYLEKPNSSQYNDNN